MAQQHPKAQAWLRLANETLSAADLLRREGRLRSAASRFYYACFQASHAIMLCTPAQRELPPRGNWDHAATMNGVVAALRRYGSVNEFTGRMIRVRLGNVYSARIQSDYSPDHFFVGGPHLRECKSAATALVKFAQRMVQG